MDDFYVYILLKMMSQPPGSIIGTLWADLDGDGVREMVAEMSPAPNLGSRFDWLIGDGRNVGGYEVRG